VYKLSKMMIILVLGIGLLSVAVSMVLADSKEDENRTRLSCAEILEIAKPIIVSEGYQALAALEGEKCHDVLGEMGNLTTAQIAHIFQTHEYNPGVREQPEVRIYNTAECGRNGYSDNEDESCTYEVQNGPMSSGNVSKRPSRQTKSFNHTHPQIAW